MNLKKLVSLALALCLVIPAGIAFAEEEVIIIEEPVAAEEVVEEVVEVEPVEVEPVAEEEIAVVSGETTLPTVDWEDIAGDIGPGKTYRLKTEPTCESYGYYMRGDSGDAEGLINPLKHEDGQITFMYDPDNTGAEWSVSRGVDCNNNTASTSNAKFFVFRYCEGTVNQNVTRTDGVTVNVHSCNHLLNSNGKAVGTKSVKELGATWTDTDMADIGAAAYATIDAITPLPAKAGDAWLIRKYTGVHHDWTRRYVPASCTYAEGYYYYCQRCQKVMTADLAEAYKDSADSSTSTSDDFRDEYLDLAKNGGKGVNIPLGRSTYNSGAFVSKSTSTTDNDANAVRFVQTGGTLDKNNHYWDTNFRIPTRNYWYTNEELRLNAWPEWTSPLGKEPTCEHGGELHGINCNACELPIVRYLDKVDHQMSGDATVVVKPTCTTNGLKAYACKWCGRTDVFDNAFDSAVEIAALGHTFNRADRCKSDPIQWVHVGTVPQDQFGNYGTYYVYRAQCEECNFYVDVLSTKTPDTTTTTGFYASDNYGIGGTNATWTAQQVVTAENAKATCATTNNHPDQAITVIPAVAATATKNGYTEGAYCSICGTIVTYPKYVAPLTAGLVKNEDTNYQWEYWVGNKKDTTFVGLVPLENELFFVRNGTVDTSVMGIQQPEEGGTWYFFDHGQVQRNHPGFALYDGAWFYIDATGKLDESATGYYAYDGAHFLVTGGWVRTDYTGMYPESDARTSFRYIVAGKWMEDFTGTVTLEGETWNVTKGVATK